MMKRTEIKWYLSTQLIYVLATTRHCYLWYIKMMWKIMLVGQFRQLNNCLLLPTTTITLPLLLTLQTTAVKNATASASGVFGQISSMLS